MRCLFFCFVVVAISFTSSSHNSHRRIENPRIVLLDCALEYKKGESIVRGGGGGGGHSVCHKFILTQCQTIAKVSLTFPN